MSSTHFRISLLALPALFLAAALLPTPAARAQQPEGPLPGPVIGSTPPPPAATSGPRIRLDEVEFYWTSVLQGKTFTKDWVVHNDGDQPLTISQIRTKCPCSSFEYPEAIAPGQSGIVKLIFDSNKIHVGTTKKSSTIYTNDPKHPEVTVWYGGAITLAFRHRPSTVQLRGLASETTTLPVTVTPATSMKFEILSTKVAYDQFEVESITPSPAEAGSFVLMLKKKAVDVPLTKPDFVKLKMRMEDGNEIEPYIPVKVIHQNSVVITPPPTKTLIFMNRDTGKLLKDESKPVQKRLTLNGANSKIRFKVTGTRLEVPENVPSDIFSVEVEEVREWLRYNVTISIHKYPSITYTNGKVFIDVEQDGKTTTHEVNFRAMFASRRR